MVNRVHNKSFIKIFLSYILTQIPAILFSLYIYIESGAQHFIGMSWRRINHELLFFGYQNWGFWFFWVFILLLLMHSNKVWRGVLCLGAVSVQCVNFLFLASMNVQDAGFNSAFMETVSWKFFETVGYGIQISIVVAFVILILSILIPVIIVPSLLERVMVRSRLWRLMRYVLTAVCLISLMFIVKGTLFYNSYMYFHKSIAYMKNVSVQLERKYPHIKDDFYKELVLQKEDKPYNIVWIFAESLEQGYFNALSTQKDALMPSLREIRAHSYVFTNIHQLPQISQTMFGTFAQLCGMFVYVNNIYHSRHCIPRGMDRIGYQTVSISGLPVMAFSMGHAFSEAGMQETIGEADIRRIISGVAEDDHWSGVYDHGLFQGALHLFNQYAGQGRPFLMTIATMDNHMPFSFISPMCHAFFMDHFLPENRVMARAARCTDMTISNFIKRIRSSVYSHHTLIVVTSDHLNPKRDDMLHLSGEKVQDRRLTFFINFPDGRSGVISKPGTHYDIGATVLDAAGFGDHQVGFGWSLLSHDKGYVDTYIKPEDQANISLMSFPAQHS